MNFNPTMAINQVIKEYRDQLQGKFRTGSGELRKFQAISAQHYNLSARDLQCKP